LEGGGEYRLRNPLREICTVGSVRGEILVAMVDLNAHEAGNGGQKPRDAYSLPSLLYSEAFLAGTYCTTLKYVSKQLIISMLLVEAAGVELFRVLITRNLLIP